MPALATPPIPGSSVFSTVLPLVADGSASSFEAATFAGVLGVVTGLLLLLSHATTQSVGSGAAPESRPETGASSVDEADAERHDDAPDRSRDAEPTLDEPAIDHADRPTTDDTSEHRPPGDPLEAMGPSLLLANVAVTQGVFLAVLVAAAVLADVPASALGLSPAAFGPTVLLAGAGLGVALYVANELGASVADGAGVEYDERLRSVLAPEGLRGWVVLLVFVLPLVAVFEEFLFRAAMVGVLAAGFGLSPWLLAVVSSVLFAAGHGIQGPAGVLVTGSLGFVLAAAFVLTGSLAAVVLAHYLINALEFVVHEGLGVEWV